MAGASKEGENFYEKCICFEEGNCGPFKKWDRDGLISVDKLDADTSGHITSLKVYYLTCYGHWIM